MDNHESRHQMKEEMARGRNFLTTSQLAKRWNLTYKTVSNWRCIGYGPKFYKVGTRVNYWLEEVEKFEDSNCRGSTSEYPPKVLKKAFTKRQKAIAKKQSSGQVTPFRRRKNKP